MVVEVAGAGWEVVTAGACCHDGLDMRKTNLEHAHKTWGVHWVARVERKEWYGRLDLDPIAIRSRNDVVEPIINYDNIQFCPD